MPIKWGIFLLGCLLIFFPRLDRAWQQLTTLPLNRNLLVDPHAPALDELAASFDAIRDPQWDQQRLFKEIERFVYGHIKYVHDWVQYGNVEDWPTLDEVTRTRQDDCDGRALVAASLSQRYGINAHLVADLSHVWVKADIGESMGPGETTGLDFTPQGVQFNWDVVWELPKHCSVGIALFPLQRELLIVLLAWILLIAPDTKWRDNLLWLALLVVALMFIREGGRARDAGLIKDWIGFGTWAVVLGVMLYVSRAARIVSREEEHHRGLDQAGRTRGITQG